MANKLEKNSPIKNLAMLERLDHSSFKAFLTAAKTLNFTLAAERAAMTQSGISQHIAKLENQLGTQLFQRVNKKVHLTRAGEILLNFVENHQERTTALFEEIHGEVGHLTGLVRYAMPHSCLFTPHFPMLLEKRKAFPEVELDVKLCPNDEIFEMLLNQQIDFGFVTKKTDNPAVKHELFAAEEYILIGSDKEQLKEVTRQNLTDFKFISYPGMDILFCLWAQNHFGAKKVSYESLNIVGNINNLRGAIIMVQHGVGLTVLPKHVAAPELKNKSVFEYSVDRKDPLMNEIHIVSLSGQEKPKRVQAVMNAFWEMK